ncbi:MAG: hypothetical protein ACI87N_003667, partial [Flavobacteriales bacterium]
MWNEASFKRVKQHSVTIKRKELNKLHELVSIQEFCQYTSLK